MSQVSNLTKDKLERLKFFLKNYSIEECCDKFKIGSPAFRESVSNTIKSLHDFYVRDLEYYVGSMTSTKDISFNEDVLDVWIKRCENHEKPNAVNECELIEANKDEITRGIINNFPSSSQLNYNEDKLRIEGALWVLENYHVTGKRK